MSTLFEPTRAFLRQESLGHFTEGHHHDVLALQKNATVETAIHVLRDHKIHSVPVLDEDGEYVGCISTGDILRGLTQELEVQLGHGWIEHLSKLTQSDLQKVGFSLAAKTVRTLIHPGDLWLKGDSNTTIMNVVLEGMKVLENKVHHRIFVVDPAKNAQNVVAKDNTLVINIKAGTGKRDSSGLRPTDVVSQMDVVKLLTEKKELLEGVWNKTLDELELDVGSVFTVPGSATALEAFHHMAVDHKSCMGIVDAAGKLVGNLSMSDLRLLDPEHYGLMLCTAAEFAVIVHGKGPSPEEALAGARVPGAVEGDWAKVMTSVPVVSLKETSTFGELLNVLVRPDHSVHRVYVQDPEGIPLSIITLTDVLRTVVKPPVPVHRMTSIPDDYLPEDSDDDEEDEDEKMAEAK